MFDQKPSFKITNDGISDLPGFLFVDHVAIAVSNGELESQVEIYQKIGFKVVHREEILGNDLVREVLLQIGESPNLIQLVEPMNERSPVQKQIDRNGGSGGLVHVGLRVKSVQVAFDYFKKHNFRIVDIAPRLGSRGTKVFFLHPKSNDDTPFGVLYEVVEDPNDTQ